MFASIGPVWDGNEVWLVVAGGATFAAFPGWYASMFSGFYLALLLVLACLIVRVVSFEWRTKSESPGWRRVWTGANAAGSFGASFVWGVGLANLLYGVPLNSSGDFTGSFWDLFNPYTLFGGVAFVLLFTFHGATFLTLRTRDDLCERAARTARRLAIPAAVVTALFVVATVVVATQHNHKSEFPPVLPAVLGERQPPARGGDDHQEPSRLGVRLDRLRGRADDGHPVHQPLPAGDGLATELRRQPDRRQRVVSALHAGRHDGDRADGDAADPPLPGLDVPRLPPPGGRRPRRRVPPVATTSRPALRRR